MSRPKRNPAGVGSRALGGSIAAVVVFSASCVTEVENPSTADLFRDVYAVTETNLVWRSTSIETTDFERLVVEPLRYRNTHLDWLRTVSPGARAANARAYETAMRSVLAANYPFVSEDGPLTLRVEAWITDAVTAEKLLPVARRYRRVVEGTDRLPEVALEVKFFAGESREPVAAFLSTAASARIQANLRRPGDPNLLLQSYVPFAERLRTALEFRRWRALE